MADGTFIDTQPTGSHLDEEVSLQDYTVDKVVEYWTMVYTLGLLAGVCGTDEEVESARQAIYDTLEDVAHAAVGTWEAMTLAADDYSPPGLGAAKNIAEIGVLRARRSAWDYLGWDTSAIDVAIARNEQELRDSVAVDINQGARISKSVRVFLEDLGQPLGLADGVVDTSKEDALIAATQSTVDARQAKIAEALNRLWEGVKEVALARYNRFMEEWEAHGLDYALGTLAIDGAFVALEAAIIALVGALTAGAGAAVAISLRVTVQIGKTAAKGARRVRVMLRNTSSPTGKSGFIPLDEGKILDHAKKQNGFGDDNHAAPGSGRQTTTDAGGPDGAAAARNTDLDPPPNDAPPFVKGRNPNDPPGVWRDHHGNAVIQDGTLADGVTPKYTPIQHASANQKGNFGEVMADQKMRDQGLQPIHPNPPRRIGDSSTGNGIDSVWRDPGPPPQYIVAESKYRTGEPFDPGDFPSTSSGPQMSPDWIEERIGNVLDEDQLDEFLISDNKRILQRIGSDGEVEMIDLDAPTGESWR